MVRSSIIQRAYQASRALRFSPGDRLSRPLPHEWLWIGFCGVMALRLLLASRADLAVGVYLLALLPYIILIALGCIATPQLGATPWQRIRLIYPFLLMNLLYQATRPVIPALGLQTQDTWLAGLDQQLLGADLRLLLDRQIGWIYTPLASDTFSVCYLLLFVLLVTGMARAAWSPLRHQAAFSIGLWSVYAIGLFGYTIVPARGPYVAFAQLYRHAVAGGWLTDFNRHVVAVGAPGYDVFPSLHVAASAFLLLWDWHTSRRWFWVSVVPVVMLWMSTVYLRYHYVVDLIAGAALALVCLAIAKRALKTEA